MKLSQRPFYPFLMALYPILSLASTNMDEISPPDYLYPALVALVGTGSLLGIANCIVDKDVRRAGLITAVFVLYFYSYGPLTAFQQKLHWSGDLPIIFVTLLTIVLLIILYRAKKIWEGLPSLLNAVTLAIVLAVLVPILSYPFSSSPEQVHQQNAEFKRLSAHLKITRTTQPLPDIYFILLDGYPRHDTLLDYYHVDNKWFVAELRRRGFWVGDKSCSNYPRTLLSLSSTLNMTYLDQVQKTWGKDWPTHKPYIDMIRHNLVARLLKEQGYRYIQIGSWYRPTKSNTYADLNLEGTTTEFNLILLKSTVIDRLFRLLGHPIDYEARRAHIISSMEALPTIPQRFNQPTYTFAHLITPHEPLFFGPKGERIRSWRLGPARYEKALSGHLRYFNRQLLNSLDTIIAESETPPVIIIQGDHGTKRNGDFDKKPWNRDFIRERMSILNAIYAPKDYQLPLQSNSTSVNTFRMVFNALFNAELPILENRQYFIESSRPLDFQDVSSQTDCG